MKIKLIIYALALSCLFSCANSPSKQDENSEQVFDAPIENPRITNREPICTDKHLNKWLYHNKIEIQLPKGFYLSSSIIHNQDSIKIGEVSAAYELLKTELTGKKFFDLFRDGGEIDTDYNHYSFNSDNEETGKFEILISDSILTGEEMWYYVVFEMDYEGEDEYGSWNAFDFCNIENNRYTGITFYNKDLKDFDISKYVKILSTVSYKN